MRLVSKTQVILGALLLSGAGSAVAQRDMRIDGRRGSSWNPDATQGRCEIRVWVDNRAQIRMRGEDIWVRTLEGSPSADRGSWCTGPIPTNAISTFDFRQLSGRGRARLIQGPDSGSNYQAVIEVEDNRAGGDEYVFELRWTSIGTGWNQWPGSVRACQDHVRQQFERRNDRDAALDFWGNSQRRRDDDGFERIRGQATARNRFERRGVVYECSIDVRRNRVDFGSYNLTGGDLRGNAAAIGPGLR